MPGHDERIYRLEESQMQCSEDMDALRKLVAKNNASLDEFVDLAKAFKFGLSILGAIEKVAVWITKIALAGGTLWGVWKFAIKEAVSRVIK